MSAGQGESLLPADVEAELLALWRQIRARGYSGIPRDELVGVAARVGSRSWQAGILPEQLIIALKESWGAHVHCMHTAERLDARCVLTELISLCIRHYFSAATRRPADSLQGSMQHR